MKIKHILSAAALGASLLLAACDSKPETVVAGDIPDPDAAKLNAAAPVELPPSIVSSHTYRCKDNSLVDVSFFDNNTATLKTDKAGATTTLTAPEAGKPYVAEGGYSITGGGSNIELTAPGKGTLSCKA
ncbi:hypothetical protein [Sphingomonas crocodyli]|uniref:C-type lysozyme inhibitor domain-containing protein n=1 Tax=Sphingomonas crocodyli TaxID=1979270 RepID=A0A437LVE9_9SPHN|nr:hypothetical protein [Sphingomonas crocodyli]RVT89411.1 hypothetical protein EOD43_21850 [Sphingomonas crocodyli]